MAIYGYLWLSMATYGYLWLSMAIYGYLWLPMAIYGYLWLSIVHHHLQCMCPYALFLTETKVKPLNPNDNTILSPRLKCPGYEPFSSFFPNGGVCAFIRSDVQTLHLKQFNISNLLVESFPSSYHKIHLHSIPLS